MCIYRTPNLTQPSKNDCLIIVLLKVLLKLKNNLLVIFFLGPMSHRQRGQWQDQPFRTNKRDSANTPHRQDH